MARGAGGILLQEIRGQIGKQIVVKRYKDKIVISAYPDMRKVKPSALQKVYRKSFAEAVAYAQAVVRDPVKRKKYEKKVKNGQTVYNYAMREYLKKRWE